MEGVYRIMYVLIGICVGIGRSWNERGKILGGIGKLVGYNEVYSIGVLEIVSITVKVVVVVGIISGIVLAWMEYVYWASAGKLRRERKKGIGRSIEGVIIGSVLLSSGSELVKNLVNWTQKVGEAEGSRIESIMTLNRELELVEGVSGGLLIMYIVLMYKGINRRKRYGLIGVISLLITPPEVRHLVEMMGLMVVLVEWRELRGKGERNRERWHKWT